MNDSLIIIGGGIAGLSSGIYAQRCGLRSVVFESHARPGGVCTSWTRGPYTMDVGIRMIIGTSHPNPFHDMLCEVGVMHRVRFETLDRLHCIEDESGGRLTLHRDLDALADELHRAAPSDGRRVERFLGILRDFSRFRPRLDLEPEAWKTRDGLGSAVALGPVARHFARYWKVPLRRWLNSFSSQKLRGAFSKIYTHADFPVLAMFSSMGWFVGGQVGRPLEGSRAIADALSDTYLELGGELNCGQRVEKILTRAGRATGVRLADGSEHHASIVISAADGHATIFKLLGGEYVDDRIRSYYRNLPLLSPIVIVHFGAEGVLRNEPETIHFPLRRPLAYLGGRTRHLNVHHISSNPSFAPPGHSVIRVGLQSENDPWARIRRRGEGYGKEKERIASQVLDRLEERHPGLSSRIRRTDVATPVTFERYTGNWQGTYEGWQSTTRTFGLRMKRTLPGLSRFYMAGQWVEPGGGVPGVLYSARRTISELCRDLDRPFTPWGSCPRSP